MTAIRNMVASTLLIGLMFTGTGCTAAAVALGAAGAGTGVMYVRGALNATVEGTPREVVAAAEDVLDEMGITVVESSSDDVEGHITARTAKDRRIRIDVQRQADTASSVKIRVGTFGDEELSMHILDQIKARL